MLNQAATLKGYKLDSLDGEIGKVVGFYFDDHFWTIRYLVANTGNWLSGRQVTPASDNDPARTRVKVCGTVSGRIGVVLWRKRRSPNDYASQIQTQTSQSAGPQTRSAEALARALPSPPTETPRHHQKKPIMNIQINTDNHISGREALAQQVEATVTSAVGHLAEHITRVEVHLSDENGNKTGDRDKRCLMEARLEGHQPIAVTDESESLNDAIAGAADKLKRSLDHTLNRLNPR